MNIKQTDILFLDIETVPQYKDWKSVPSDIKSLWEHRMRKNIADGEKIDESWHQAGLYAEFGKIVCISIGATYRTTDGLKIGVKSFSGDDESKILTDFIESATDFLSKNVYRTLCGHNGKSFDFPFIARRCIIDGIKVPDFLQVAGKKPWEITFIDTMELWRFGDFKSYCSLKILTNILGIPSPKDDIDGSQVAEVYYKEKNIKRIAEYCEKDVIATAKVLFKILQVDGIVD